MLFESPPIPLPSDDEIPASAIFRYDDANPGAIVVEMGGQVMHLGAFYVSPDLGPALVEGSVAVVVVAAPNEVIACNLVRAGSVLAHVTSSPEPQWSPAPPPVAWSAASVEHDGAGNVRVIDGSGNVIKSL